MMQLINHAYGLLCLRMLALILQVAVLECIDKLTFTTVLKDCRTHPVLTRSVAAVVQGWMATEHDYRSRQRRHFRNLKWYRDPEKGNQQTCLPAVGGMSEEDIEFLLRVLNVNSERCQQLFRGYAFQGYCTMLFVIWQKLLNGNP